MTEKEFAIRDVILKRVAAIDEVISVSKDREYFIGKREGLMQAFALVGECLESIKVELEDEL